MRWAILAAALLLAPAAGAVPISQGPTSTAGGGGGGGGGGSGDVTAVFSCATGDCNSVNVEAGETLGATGTGSITATGVDAVGAGPISIGSPDVTEITIDSDGLSDPVTEADLDLLANGQVDLGSEVAGLLAHENGGLEGDVSLFTGLLAVTGGATSEIDSKSELEGQLADVSDICEADGDTYTGTHDYSSATVNLPSDAVDALAEIAAALRSGVDAELLTGTIATTNAILCVNGDDDAVDCTSLTWDGSTLTLAQAGAEIDVQAHATNGQCSVLKEGADDGSNTISLCAPDTGVTSNVVHDFDAAGEVDAETFIQDGSIDDGHLDAAINVQTTGVVHGRVTVNAETGTSHSVTCAEMQGEWHTYDNSGVVTITLPEISTCGAGAHACFYDLDGTAILTIDVDAADVITLDGTALDAGDTIDSPGAVGNYICLMSLDAVDDWHTLGRAGTWVDGGAT